MTRTDLLVERVECLIVAEPIAAILPTLETQAPGVASSNVRPQKCAIVDNTSLGSATRSSKHTASFSPSKLRKRSAAPAMHSSHNANAFRIVLERAESKEWGSSSMGWAAAVTRRRNVRMKNGSCPADPRVSCPARNLSLPHRPISCDEQDPTAGEALSDVTRGGDGFSIASMLETGRRDCEHVSHDDPGQLR